MTFEDSLTETTRTLQALDTIRPAIDKAGELILKTLSGGGKLVIGGNGGSAAEAAHFATELVGRYEKNRRALAAVAMTDGSLITSIGNDFGFEQSLARQIAGLARPGDLVVLISSSGNSPNIVAALAESKRLGLSSIALLARGGGKSKGLATCDVIVPGNRGPSAQEAHLFLIHHFCELIEAEFKG